MRFRAIMGWVTASAMLSAAASAHHSFAMFDQRKIMTLTGKVVDFQWTNPHSFIELEVVTKGKAVERWSVEMNSPNNLRRQGWKPTSVKVGDKVTVTFAPLRNGKKGGLFIAIATPDGKVLGDPTKAGVTPLLARPGG